MDAAGDLYIADNGNNRIRKISNGVITTIAGNGAAFFSDNNGPATSAQLAFPSGVAANSTGDIYIADTFNNEIRKVSGGVITTVAGNGNLGFGGDNGPATKALLGNPYSVAVDSADNLYIADSLNNRVRKVSNGVITTVAGNGTAGFSGDNGLAINAQLTGPIALAVDAAGNLYITGNNRIRKVSNGVITTIAGNGTAGFSGDNGPAINAQLADPSDLAVDSLGNLYVADNGNNRIRKVSNGVITTVAGNGILPSPIGDNGPATDAELFSPSGVAVDSNGNLYLGDSGFTIRKISNGVITTIAGSRQTGGFGGDNGPAVSAQLNNVRGLAVDPAGHAYVADSYNHRVRVLTPTSLSTSSINSVTNAASNLPGPIAPGEIVVLYGSGLGPAQLTSAHVGSDGLYDAGLAGTSVQFNGIPAPMIYTSATQVAAIVPYELTGASAQVTATYQGQTSASVTVAVAPSAPGLFTHGSTGQGQAAAINQDGSINTSAKPAPIGSIISLYATGEGQTSPAGVNGKPATTPLPIPNLPVSVTIGGVTVNNLQYVGGAPGEVAGLLQINVQIPSGVLAGNSVPIVLNVGGKTSQASVTLAVASAVGSQSLAVTSLSSTSVTPLTPLYIGTTGLTAAAPVTIQFSNGPGFSFTEQPLRVGSDGTVVAAVPLYFDPTTYTLGPGSVSMVLTQAGQSTAPKSIAIQDLSSVTSYGTQPGQISHAFLVYEAMLIARRINELQAYQMLPGNKVDTSQAQASLRTLLAGFTQARTDVAAVSLNQSVVIPGGTFSNGFPIQFDHNSLDLMDRIIGLHLSQIAPVVLSAPNIAESASAAAIHSSVPLPRNRFTLPSKGEAPEISGTNLDTVLNAIDSATNQIGLAQATSDYYAKDATAIDKGLAVGSGLGSFYGQLTLGAEGRAATAGNVYGALVSSASLLNNLGMELGDLGFLMFASHYGGDRNVIAEATDDLNTRATGSVYSTINAELSLLTISNPESNLLKSLALVSAVEQCNSASCYSNLDTTSIQAGAETSTTFSSPTLGFAILDGTAQIPYSTGLVPPTQNEVQLSSNGVVFNGVADENGNFQMFVPLQVDPFRYTSANFQVLDPTTQDILAQSAQVIDLSMLTTAAPLRLPTINIVMDYFECFNVFEVIDYGQCVNLHPYPDVSGLLTCVNAVNAAFNACAAAAQNVTSGSAHRVANRTVSPAGPGLFSLNPSGKGQVAAVNQNGFINTASTPADEGDLGESATGHGDTATTVSCYRFRSRPLSIDARL